MTQPPRRNPRPSERRRQPGPARTGRLENKTPPAHEPVHLADDVVRELKATARPGKGDILVKVFADAVAAFVAEDYAEAVKLGDQAKHIALRSVPVREFLGLAYYRSGRYAEAATELAAFRRLSGSTDQNPVLADCYRATGKPEKAIPLADEIDARKADPAIYYEGQIVAAGALRDLKRGDEGIERLQELELNPEVVETHHLRAWYVLADLLESRGRFTQARELFEAVSAADEDATDAGERARKLRASR